MERHLDQPIQPQAGLTSYCKYMKKILLALGSRISGTWRFNWLLKVI